MSLGVFYNCLNDSVGSREFGGLSEGLNRVFDGSTETVEELAALNEGGGVLKTNATGSAMS